MTQKSTNNWKLAGFYFLLYTAIAIVLSAIYSLLFVYIFSQIYLNDFISQIISLLVSFVTVWLSIRLAISVITKYFSTKNPDQIAKIATVFSLVVTLAFLARDLFMTNIDGMPIVRNYPLSIAEEIFSLVMFFFLTKYYLSKKHSS